MAANRWQTKFIMSNKQTNILYNYWLFIEFCAKCKLDHTVLMIQVDPLERNDVSTKHKSTKVKE